LSGGAAIRHEGKTTVTTLGARLLRPLRTCALWLVHGTSGDGRVRLELGDEPVALGREAHPSGGWVLADPEVSRLHVLLAREPGGAWTLTDQGSRNGTWVDGKRVQRVTLTDGAVVRMGQCVLVFRDAPLEPGAVEPEAAPLLGPSSEMQRLRGDVARLAPTPAPVLVVGEAGTEKARVAEQLHARSGRAGALVPVDASMAPGPADLERAHGGTLFVEEVEALPLEAQALLADLLGGSGASGGAGPRVDVRLVVGTQRPPEEAVREGTLRADLRARLPGPSLRVPPLRARREDVVPLARSLLARRAGAPLLSADAAEALSLFAWPGNVHQLERTLAEARARAEGGAFLLCEHLPQEVAAPLLARASTDLTPQHTPALMPPMGGVTLPPEGLSPRMRQTLEHLLAGASEKEVAVQLGLSSHTVHDYVKKLYRHFGVSSRAELLATVLGRR
jgi:DNA-binding NtrC family response regulator